MGCGATSNLLSSLHTMLATSSLCGCTPALLKRCHCNKGKACQCYKHNVICYSIYICSLAATPRLVAQWSYPVLSCVTSVPKVYSIMLCMCINVAPCTLSSKPAQSGGLILQAAQQKQNWYVGSLALCSMSLHMQCLSNSACFVVRDPSGI